RDVYGPDGLQNTADDSIPAAYPEVMTISALADLDGVSSSDDRLASFSNYSRSVVAGNPVTSPGAAIDLAAPGLNIASTYLNGGYATMSGTSMASPHAAGAAALYIASHSRATNAAGVYAIRQALISLAQPQSAWGSANTYDPDANHEGLVYVSSIGGPYNNPPTVAITAPGTGSTLTSGSAVTFTGAATDPESGTITSSLVWTSSIDGQIGTGGSFSKALSPGNHTITASVTDPGGKTGQAAITITVNSSSSGATSSFANVSAITIPDVGPATPYPSAINVSGLAGTISQVTVTLNNLSHAYAPDVDILLRSEEHTSELQSRGHLVCRLLLEKKKNGVWIMIAEAPALMAGADERDESPAGAGDRRAAVLRGPAAGDLDESAGSQAYDVGTPVR